MKNFFRIDGTYLFALLIRLKKFYKKNLFIKKDFKILNKIEVKDDEYVKIHWSIHFSDTNQNENTNMNQHANFNDLLANKKLTTIKFPIILDTPYAISPITKVQSVSRNIFLWFLLITFDLLL